jgi:hypothetical protein
MKSWSVDEMMAEGPCLSRRELVALAGGRERVSLLEIVLDGRISSNHAIWCATRPGALSPKQLQAWIELVVGVAVERYAAPHPATKAWALAWDLTARATSARAAAAEAAEAAAWAAGAASAEAAGAAAAEAAGAAGWEAAGHEQRAFLLGVL